MRSLEGKNVLVTCGPTWVPIDDVRVISNRSTGALGQSLAAVLDSRGARVTLLEGPVRRPLKSVSVTVRPFCFYEELANLLRQELSSDAYRVVIHAAAVADYRLKHPRSTKISSQSKGLTLELVPTEKIIGRLKVLCPGIFLVGFKLESSLNKSLAVEKTRALFQEAGCDLVVANTVTDDQYQGYILDKQARFLAEVKSRQEMVEALVHQLDVMV